jgi:hypothetical protein
MNVESTQPLCCATPSIPNHDRFGACVHVASFTVTPLKWPSPTILGSRSKRLCGRDMEVVRYRCRLPSTMKLHNEAWARVGMRRRYSAPARSRGHAEVGFHARRSSAAHPSSRAHGSSGGGDGDGDGGRPEQLTRVADRHEGTRPRTSSF